MLDLKSCSRCGGDMTSNRDRYGAYMFCLQCGNLIELVDPMDRAKYSPPTGVATDFRHASRTKINHKSHHSFRGNQGTTTN